MATQTSTEVELSRLDESLTHSSLRRLSEDVRAGIAVLDTSTTDDPSPNHFLTVGRSWIVVMQLAGINFLTSFSTGLVTIGLPAMAKDLYLDPSLMLWPSAAYSLTMGTCLLLAGAFADVVGPRSVALTGAFFVGVFTLASGFARTGIELIMFRAMQDIASAMTFPPAIALISSSIPSGKRRNIGFASLGLAMPLGFSIGLVLGGVLVTGLGWRVGYYIGGAATFVLFGAGIWALPAAVKHRRLDSIWTCLVKEIDWVGAGIASTALALFSYVLSKFSADLNNIKDAPTAAMLGLSLLLGPAFAIWVHQQEKHGRPALIPNSIWKKTAFTSICIMVLLSTAVMNAFELFSSLFFQEVQGYSALQASIRILPSAVVGIALNFLTGYFVNKVPVIYAVLISSGLCAVAPLLMATINPRWPYWYDAFFAQVLSPLSADVLFTVGIIVVSNEFPDRTQALAGAVFNTVAQLGTSIGLATTAVISRAVTSHSGRVDKQSPTAFMEGYRAAFWTLFACMVTACIVGVFGLRRLGRIGEKRD